MLFLDKEPKESPNTANINEIPQYWKKIVGVKKSFEHKNPLLNAWKQALTKQPEEKDLRDHFTKDVWQRIVSKIKPWKAPGPDGLQSFWWKSFKRASTSLFRLVHDHLTSGKPLLLQRYDRGTTEMLTVSIEFYSINQYEG